MSKMRKKKMDFLSSETDDDDDVSDVDPEELQKMLEVCLLFILLKFNYYYFLKVHLFWEGHEVLRNLHLRFDPYYIGQIYGGDIEKFCGLLRIYEL